MDRLRRILIHKSENGYMFSIKDMGQPYSEAAPVNKVAVNGPADSAGLRSGDGVVAINSNLVKGKTFIELCNIIKTCGGTSLELTIIENYYLSNLQQNKSQDERQLSSSTSTPLSLEESSAQKYSPILIKKKAYTYDKETLENFSALCTDDPKSCNSALELDSEVTDIDTSNQISGRYKAQKPKINYKKAKNSFCKSVTKSDLDINNIGKVSTDSTNLGVVSSKIVQYDPSKVVYHQAYKHTPSKRPINSKSISVSQQNEITQKDRRGSTPVISDSSSLTPSKGNRQSKTKGFHSEPLHKAGKRAPLSKSSTQTSSPVLQLNRVGGFVRAPLSVDETLDLDDECIEDIDSMLNSVDANATDYSSATAVTTESGRSSCDLDTMDSFSKGKFRHMHCSPMPYKSHNISNNSLSLNITPTTEQSRTQTQKYESPKLRDRPLSSPLAKSSPCTDVSYVTDTQESSYQESHSYQSSSVDDNIPGNEDLESVEDVLVHQNSKQLKKLKNIFGDNYRCRSKTLDSDGKLKNDIDVKVTPTSVFVKWIMYEGKSHKSSWKQYIINIDDDQLVFLREKAQNYMKSTSLEDVTMSIVLLNITIEEEPEKRGRKNTLRLFQAGKQTECLIEFLEKSVSVNWLHIIGERNKLGKVFPLQNKFNQEDKDSRTASFKERHSLTVPNLYGKDTSPTQFNKSKTKFKEDTTIPSQVAITSTTVSSSTQSNKSMIHQAMSRVKNLKHKFASSGQVSDFERQQEEWFNKTGTSSTNNKLVSSFSYSEDFQGGFDSVSGSGQSITLEFKPQTTCNEAGISNMLPLQKWQRSNFSPLVPLVVELCVSIIETFGMNLVGLYRVSGNKVALDFISAELHKPISEIDVTTDKWNDLHAISGVLKSFFRNLPDGLFPKDLYSDIIGACRLHEFDRERRLLSIQRFLSIMDIAQDHPEYRYHRETLRYLAEHLSRVAGRHSTNKMNAKNLAVIFAPSLMKPPQETNQMLVNDYKYKIQLIETLIKYHKWLFSPTLESACSIPSGSDDDLPLEDQQGDQSENVDSWPHEITDARPLVKKIFAKAKKITSDSLENLESPPLNYIELNNDSSLTLAELSKQAYEFNCMDVGFKEVDIDEECEKRKGKADNSVIDKLKSETQNMLTECSKDIDELNDIQNKCQQDLCLMQYKIKKVDEEILKTESYLENTKEKAHLSKPITSQLFEIPGKNLSSLSVVLASPVLSPQIGTPELHKC